MTTTLRYSVEASRLAMLTLGNVFDLIRDGHLEEVHSYGLTSSLAAIEEFSRRAADAEFQRLSWVWMSRADARRHLGAR